MEKKRGRPSRLDQALIARIAKNVAIPIPFKFACEREGVHETSGHEWMAKGEAGEKPYDEFYLAVTRARAESVVHLTQHTLAGGRGSMGAQFQLERRFREHYGPTQRIEHSGPDGKAIEVKRSLAEMSDEELIQLAEGK